jgi:thiamine-monophosphate kinase
MNEFDMIRRYFAAQTQHRADVIHGIGDDAAIVRIPDRQELAITTDTLVEGVHFAVNTLPYDIGYKSLAVNLSDLAAMGATPAWITLALTLPKAADEWLRDFCAGFFALANRFGIQLIGGDLTRGPLSITVQAMGFVPQQQAILRSGARPSDLIYVTGTLGDAGLGLACLQKKIRTREEHEKHALERLLHPEPRLAVGEALRGIASAAIDISDGMSADLGHILDESHVGAVIDVEKLPLSDTLKDSLPAPEAIAMALTAGDDYELCFTIPAHKRDELQSRLSSISCSFTCIGAITAQAGLELLYEDGKKYHGPTKGYEHF